MSADPLPSFGAGSPPPLPAARAIARLAHAASYNIGVESGVDLLAVRDMLAAGTSITIAWSEERDHGATVDLARAIRNAGFEPTVQVAVGDLRDIGAFWAFIDALHDECGLTALHLLGERSENMTALQDALVMLVQLRGKPHGLRSIGLTGVPRARSEGERVALDAELDTMLAVAQDAGLDAFVQTRVDFDAGTILSWLEALRARGHEVPVRIGLAGPASLPTLFEIAEASAIASTRATAHALVLQGVSMSPVSDTAAADPVIRDLAEAGASEHHGPLSLHLFPCGGFARMVRWMAPILTGRIALRRNDPGFQPLDGPAGVS